MAPREQRFYLVETSRLMCGGRLYSRGDVLAASSVDGPFGHLLRSGALRALPQGLHAVVSIGEMVDLDERDSSRAWRYREA